MKQMMKSHMIQWPNESDRNNEVCRSLNRWMWAGVIQKGFNAKVGFRPGRTFIGGKGILGRETTEVRMSIIQWSVGTNQRQMEVTENLAKKGTCQELAIIQALGNEGLPVDNFQLVMACELPLSW